MSMSNLLSYIIYNTYTKYVYDNDEWKFPVMPEGEKRHAG